MELLESRQFLSLTPVGAETTVPGSAGAFEMDVAVADNGSFLVATRAGVGDSLQVVRYSASGTQVGSAITIDTTADRYFSHISLAADADGEAVVVYFDSDPQNGIGEFFFRRISKAGVLSAPVLVDSNLGGDSDDKRLQSAAVDMDASVRFVVGWLTTLDRDNHHVNIHAYNADGSSRGAAFDAETLTSPFGDVGGLDLEVASDGNSAVYVLAHSFSDSQSRENRGGRISATASLGTFDVGGNNQPEVALNADGSFAVSYAVWGSSAGEEYRMTSEVQRYTAGGTAVGAPIVLGASLPSAGQGVHGVALADHPDGGFVATYSTVTKTDITGTNGGVTYSGAFTLYAEQFDAAGNSVGARVLLDAGGKQLIGSGADIYGRLFHPLDIDIDAAGDAVAAYVQNGDVSSARFRLLSSDSVILERGTLSILGTDADDSFFIDFDEDDNTISVSGSVANQTFAAADVQFISINSLGGNDWISNITDIPCTLSGGEGDDTVYGGGGDDKIRGESGRDSLWGREGNDTIFGDDGVDSCYGNGGRDRIDGGANSDHMRGNSGRDKLFGGHGNDRIYGSESADWLYGGIGDDHLYGEGSNDILYGESGVDTLEGLAGDDVLISSGDDSIDALIGGRGRDTADADQNDVLSGIESVV